MSDGSKIEWTDATWNPITGCTLVSDGCNNCYAAHLAATRLKHHPSRQGLARLNAAGVAKFTGEVRFNEQWLDQPLRWTSGAPQPGRVPMTIARTPKKITKTSPTHITRQTTATIFATECEWKSRSPMAQGLIV